MEVKVYSYYTGKVMHVASSLNAAIKWVLDQAEHGVFQFWEESDYTVLDVGTLYYIKEQNIKFN